MCVCVCVFVSYSLSSSGPSGLGSGGQGVRVFVPRDEVGGFGGIADRHHGCATAHRVGGDLEDRVVAGAGLEEEAQLQDGRVRWPVHGRHREHLQAEMGPVPQRRDCKALPICAQGHCCC